MKCENCPALTKDGYECPEYYCGLGEDEREFNDATIGCNRKSTKKIITDLDRAYGISHDICLVSNKEK